MTRHSDNGSASRAPFTGCGTALVTPFNPDGSVDEAAVRRLGRRQIEGGAHFLVPLGTTGENPTLSLVERLRIVEILVDEAKGRVPILVGAGGYDTREVIHLAAELRKAGADGFLSVTPYYNKPTQEGLYQHYRALADSTPLPIIPYNVPPRTSCNLEVSTVVRLASIPNIVGIKEASGNMSQVCDLCGAVPSEFIVLSGDDALTLPMMSVGARGVISVVSNEIPAEMSQMIETAERNDFLAARTIHARILPLMQVNFVESSPGPVKVAMAAMGLLQEIYRLPLVSPKSSSKERIVAVLKDLKLIDKPAYA
jgi:4-hydroxy-tetrahydrodipicolinate synthase